MNLDIVYSDPGGVGYHPVLYMARLAAELLEGNLSVVPCTWPSLGDKILGVAIRRRRFGPKKCLLICAQPSDLNTLLRIPQWRSAYSQVVAWVFDSFWINYIPRVFRLRNHFDHIFLTEPEDLDAWKKALRAPVSLLPWGSDVLRLGSANPSRPHDVLRFGRQPPSWDDDAVTAAVLQKHGLAFHGRPEERSNAEENARVLTTACANTKFTLSFSNRVSPAVQTHPRREYITARWTDALASGAIVAGVPPNTSILETLLWPGALLPLATTDLEEGALAIGRAVRAWTPDRATNNYHQALERLDWRWRFQAIADVMGIKSEKLDLELAAIQKRIHPRDGDPGTV